MRFDVRHFVPISNTLMAWFFLAHVLTFYLAAWGLRASLEARAVTAQSIPVDIWSASLTDFLAWGGAIAAFYFSILVSFANGVAPTLVIGQWTKTNSWPLPGLWMGLFAAVHVNVWLYCFMKFAVIR